MKYYKYTLKDIETLKREKAPGFVFVLFILGAYFLATLLLLVDKPEGYVFWIKFVCILGLISSALVYYLVNRSVICDLKEQEVLVITTKIKDKRIEIDYEAGSGVLFIPILGNIFSKQYGATMRPFEKNMFYLENGRSLNISKETYKKHQIGDSIDILYSKNAKVFLRIEKSKK